MSIDGETALCKTAKGFLGKKLDLYRFCLHPVKERITAKKWHGFCYIERRKVPAGKTGREKNFLEKEMEESFHE